MRSLPKAPTRTSQLVSKAFLRQRLHKATGASRVSEDTVDDAVTAVETLTAMMVDCVREAYDDQVAARAVQSPSNPAKPPLHPRHVERALAVLFRTLPPNLKKLVPVESVWQPTWSQAVTHPDAPETA